MMASDAVNPTPSLDEQMGAFKGFSTQDGEVQAAAEKAPEAKEPAPKPLTAAERLASFDKPAKETKDDAQPEDEAEEVAEGAGEAEGEAAEDREQPKPERRADPNKRIAQAVGRQRAAERERDEANARHAALEARLARLEGGGLTRDPRAGNIGGTEDSSPPNSADYQYGELDTKFIADTARYETLRTLREQEAHRAQAQRQSQEAASRDAMAEKYREFEATGLARYDDFVEVVSESAKRREWSLSPLLAALIVDSDHGTDIAYHLATNRDEAKRVYELTPAQQAKWFGQREAVLSSGAPGGQSVAARVSQAPGAPRREARGTGSRQQVSPDTSDFAAFEKLANRR